MIVGEQGTGLTSAAAGRTAEQQPSTGAKFPLETVHTGDAHAR